MFHAECVAELRKFKLNQASLLCRTPLPTGPEKLLEETALRFTVGFRRVKRGKASWSALKKTSSRKIHAAVGGWRAAAADGLAHPQFTQGRSVARSGAEAARWIRKAPGQGLAQTQYNLGISLAIYGRGVYLKQSADQGCAKKNPCQGKNVRLAGQGFSGRAALGFH